MDADQPVDFAGISTKTEIGWNRGNQQNQRRTISLEVEGFTDAPPPSAVVAAHHSAGDADHH